MRSRFAFADRAQSLGKEFREIWIAPVAGQRAHLQREVDALIKRVPPPASTQLDAAERTTLEKLATAAQLFSAERRVLFTNVHEGSPRLRSRANDLRVLHASDLRRPSHPARRRDRPRSGPSPAAPTRSRRGPRLLLGRSSSTRNSPPQQPSSAPSNR